MDIYRKAFGRLISYYFKDATLGEESGELTQAALDFVYNNGTIEHMKEEAVQCGAMAIRFLENLARYEKFKKAKEFEATTVTWITFDGTEATKPGVDGVDGLIILADSPSSRPMEPGDRWAYLPMPPVRDKED